MKFTFNPDINFLHTSLGYEAQGNNGDLDFLMQFGKDYSLLQNKLYQQSTNQTLTSNYADFQEIAGLLVPKNIQILIMAEKLNLNAIMNYDNINLNQELSFPFQVPSGFKQIN
jgi:outer membrane receptor protein involved in Fe transport